MLNKYSEVVVPVISPYPVVVIVVKIKYVALM